LLLRYFGGIASAVPCSIAQALLLEGLMSRTSLKENGHLRSNPVEGLRIHT